MFGAKQSTMRIKYHHLILLLAVIAWVMTVEISLAQQDVMNLSSAWKNCTNSISTFTNLTQDQSGLINRNLKLPNFGCESVNIPDFSKMSLLKYWRTGPDLANLDIYVNTPKSDLCSTYGQLEQDSGFSCMQLCQHDYFQPANGSEVYHWINYCTYCSRARGFEAFNNVSRRQQCNSKNETINEMINSFPDSIRYCGSNLGVPMVAPLQVYSYICYCFQVDYYGMDCKKMGFEILIKTLKEYSGMVVCALLLLADMCILVIPKTLSFFMKRQHMKSSVKILPAISLCLASSYAITSYAFSLVGVNNSVSEFFSQVSQLTTFYSLCPILIYWSAVPKYLTTHQRGRQWPSYFIAMFIFMFVTTIGAFLSLILPMFIRKSELGFLFANVGISWFLEVVLIVVFFSISLMIHRTLKKISDINTFGTSVSITNPQPLY